MIRELGPEAGAAALDARALTAQEMSWQGKPPQTRSISVMPSALSRFAVSVRTSSYNQTSGQCLRKTRGA